MTQQATAPAPTDARPPARPGVPAGVRLSTLRTGDRAVVVGLAGTLAPAVRRRLHDLGVAAGTPVTCLRRAPFGSPVVYRVGDTDLCLRRALTDAVVVAVP
jgi:Fe2+ transport system protein FeoA